MSKEKKINVIGMDVFQTAAVKRNYQNVKPLIKERKKMEEKIAELSKNLEIKKAQIAANDQHTGMITKETCGIALTSEQVMSLSRLLILMVVTILMQVFNSPLTKQRMQRMQRVRRMTTHSLTSSNVFIN